MSPPDDPTETFEQSDEAIDDASALDPDFIEEIELDPSLDPSFQGDDKELEERFARLKQDPNDRLMRYIRKSSFEVPSCCIRIHSTCR